MSAPLTHGFWNTNMHMIIASRLTDGRVVFLSERGTWVPDIGAGAVIDDEDDANSRLAEAQRAVSENRVVDPYLIDVVIDGKRRPARVREAIRAFGPSVRTDLEAAHG